MSWYEFFNGLLWIAFIFAICFIAVFGVKSLADFIGIKPRKKPEAPSRPKKRRAPTGKTVVIDPEGVSKISFKKSKVE